MGDHRILREGAAAWRAAFSLRPWGLWPLLLFSREVKSTPERWSSLYVPHVTLKQTHESHTPPNIWSLYVMYKSVCNYTGVPMCVYSVTYLPPACSAGALT